MLVRLAFLRSKAEPQSAGKRSEGRERRAGRMETMPAIVTCWHWPLGTGAPLISYWMSVNTPCLSIILSFGLMMCLTQLTKQQNFLSVCGCYSLLASVASSSLHTVKIFWVEILMQYELQPCFPHTAWPILKTKWRNLLTTQVKLCLLLATLERETLPLNRKVSTGQVKVGFSKWGTP